MIAVPKRPNRSDVDGIDIEALEDNLKRSVEERLLRHAIALSMFEALREAKCV